MRAVRFLFAIAFAVTLLQAGVAAAQPPAVPNFNQQEKTFSRISNAARITRYLLYLPEGYDRDEKRRWPVLLYLHGADARGATSRKLEQEGLPYVLRTGTKLSFIVVAPLCPGDDWWSSQGTVENNNALLDEIGAKYRTDADRFYLTGWSMGGAGAWRLANEYPRRFAAVVPLAGRSQLKYVPNLLHMPVWAFHGTDDPVVPVSESRKIVDALATAGGIARISLLAGAGHDIWRQVYGNPQLYEWLLSFPKR